MWSTFQATALATHEPEIAYRVTTLFCDFLGGLSGSAALPLSGVTCFLESQAWQSSEDNYSDSPFSSGENSFGPANVNCLQKVRIHSHRLYMNQYVFTERIRIGESVDVRHKGGPRSISARVILTQPTVTPRPSYLGHDFPQNITLHCTNSELLVAL